MTSATTPATTTPVTIAVITGSGLFTPKDSITNAELVEAQAAGAEIWNREHAAAISAGTEAERVSSSDRFIVKASGIKARYVVDKAGILDPARQHPIIRSRGEDEVSLQAEMCLAAIRPALTAAGRRGEDVDAVIVACSNLQRPYPAIAIEVQSELGAGGWGYDLNVACSSATFGIQAAVDAIRGGSARCVVVVNPEITSGHNNFELRDSHFIFGDACTAVVIEAGAPGRLGFEVLGTRLETTFSNNIRNDFGFLNPWEEPPRAPHDLLFRQNGRSVVRDVVPLAATHIEEHVAACGVDKDRIARLWLHQANLVMNEMIGRRVMGRDPTPEESPVILDEYANTSSAGSVIAFHQYSEDLAAGDVGVLCSFGAGYSIGSAVLRKL